MQSIHTHAKGTESHITLPYFLELLAEHTPDKSILRASKCLSKISTALCVGTENGVVKGERDLDEIVSLFG